MVVCSGMFDLKIKDVERNILSAAGLCVCPDSTPDALDLLEKPAQ
jgi:hypothetical protein